MRHSLPLGLRLPNPPPEFCGRIWEQKWLCTAQDRGPIVAISGPGGTGKTALSLHYVHSQMSESLERTLYLELRPDTPVEDARLQLLRALSTAEGLTPSTWLPALGQPGMLEGILIDLAEAGPWCILIDDLQNAGSEAALSIVNTALRYARKSRWMFLGRSPAQFKGIAPQHLQLPGLDDHTLSTIARVYAPQVEESHLARFVQEAAGSPLRLRLALTATPGDPGEDPLLGELSEDAWACLKSLSVVDIPLNPKVLRDVLGPHASDLMASFELRGLTQVSPGGWRLHDVVIKQLQLQLPESQRILLRQDMAHRLGEQRDTHAFLEGLRLNLLLGQLEVVNKLLRSRGMELIRGGMASKLWAMLDGVADPRFDHWRLRAGLIVGTPHCLGRVRLPQPSTPEDQMLWAQALTFSNQSGVDSALKALSQAQATEDTRLTFLAGITAINALIIRFRFKEACDLGATLNAPDTAWQHYLELCMAVAQGGIGPLPTSTHSLFELEWPALFCDPALALYSHLTMLAQALGRFDLARKQAHLLLKSEGASLPRAASLSLAVNVNLLTGHFGDALNLLNRLKRIVGPVGNWTAILRRHSLTHSILAGAFASAHIRLHEEKVAWAGDAQRAYLSGQSEADLGRILAQPLSSDPEISWETCGWLDHIWGLAHTRRRIRMGLAAETGAERVLMQRQSVLAVRSLSYLVKMERATVQGALTEALRYGELARMMVNEAGMGILEFDIRLAQLDAIFLSDMVSLVRHEANDLEVYSRHRGSPRFEAIAQFFKSISETTLCWGQIQSLSNESDVAPTAARRCQALLGGQPHLDQIDQMILRAIRGRGAFCVDRLEAGVSLEVSPVQPWTPPWVLDLVTQRIWLEDGKQISLQGRTLQLNFLNELFELGGEANKEQLVNRVWNQPKYHPLNHDNRIHLTVNRLRKLLGDDPASPHYLLTIEGGYRLAQPAIRVMPVQRCPKND